MDATNILQVHGYVPSPRFGHTLTQYTQQKFCLFGGAVGTTTNYTITDEPYSFNMSNYQWKKIDTTGQKPSRRAAHAAVHFQKNKILLYGGVTEGGVLTADQLYLLEIKQGVGIWNIINIARRTPGKRYGHTMTYSSPYLIIFGGILDDGQPNNNVWVLNTQQRQFIWEQIKFYGPTPSPRSYHSAALCSKGQAAGMMIIYGGRSNQNKPLKDCWGLKMKRNGTWDWMQAPLCNEPTARFQHTAIFKNEMMLIVGGKANNNQVLPIQVFDTSTNAIFQLGVLSKFRHTSWIYENSLYLYGGIELLHFNQKLNENIMEMNLEYLLKNNSILQERIERVDQSFEFSTSSIKQAQSNKTNRSEMSTKLEADEQDKFIVEKKEILSPYFVKSKERCIEKPSKNIQPQINEEVLSPIRLMKKQSSERPQLNSLNFSMNRKKIKMLSPIFGKIQQKNRPQPNSMVNINRELAPKQNIANLFLFHYMRPKQFANAHTDSIKIMFTKQQAFQLVDLAEQIIASQPMLVKAKAPLKIFGDIHGQFTDLMAFFNLYGTPHQINERKDVADYDYIFLGDYVDRGSNSLQTLLLLLALKVTYPNQIYLLRGNHEDVNVNKDFGFMGECQLKMDEQGENPNSLYIRINQLFQWLPLAALADDSILCVHGGIGKSFNCIQEVYDIKRPLQISHHAFDKESQIILDILWSDPTETDQQFGIQPNYCREPTKLGQIGNIVRFGPDRVINFLKNNKLSMIVRAHECVMDGFERFAGGSLITVFSATDYSGRHKNAGAILTLKTNKELVPKVIYPKNNNANNWLEDNVVDIRRSPTPPRWRVHS